ncbi:S-layer domain protein [Thermoclostridium stercorarium subsp. stercorarium DSM 8532]|uniref:S-layer domain protein n=1 Tax=Thermoclostridium stercorarium (strain ATCC 35414 / DSM 8532 / NCIMB 11754) TaxID=1121335 RepID=L7VQ15_THES1|nr:S-layer homology domain-containing protein [Thermoclostridium stercorarium]AGC68784.1 S-layer domain protein [Thermoclostridium stercorarium subsp. stercorarium DSM 8532]AGI39789.1 SLH domain-containing protein [Thermoclostridium stercorarium subsp. stercorarium DSM 8532]UZQ84751.1 S-layer homology domain-containing protein [Thermoclostridium stercorarium]
MIKKQKNISKILSFVMALSMILTTGVYITQTKVFATSAVTFEDVKTTDWFYNNVMELTKRGLISGYPDKTFRPNSNIKVDEFVKILVSAIDESVISSRNGYWAEGYINKAKELGIIQDGEFSSYTRNITRGEIARMIVRAGTGTVADEKGINLEIPENYTEYAPIITDYSTLDTASQDIALKIFVSGIITGFADGTIGFNKNATRAEASAILMRFLEKDQRRIPQLPEDLGNTLYEEKQIPNPASVFEKRKNGLNAFSAEELKILLDEIYPGDNLTQEWIDTYPAEKLYEYFGQKYHDTFYDYIRTSEKVIDNSTVECDITVRLSDGSIKKHKVRLKMDDNLFWSVISDDIVQ